MKNANKIAMAEVAKVLSTIDLRSKHSQAIINTDIHTVGDPRLIYIKKYQRRIRQI